MAASTSSAQMSGILEASRDSSDWAGKARNGTVGREAWTAAMVLYMVLRVEKVGPGSRVQCRYMMQGTCGSEKMASCCALRGWVEGLKDCESWRLAAGERFGRVLTIFSWASSQSQDRKVTSRLKLCDR